jgi:hypothetical protein
MFYAVDAQSSPSWRYAPVVTDQDPDERFVIEGDPEDALRGLLQVDDAGSPVVTCCFCGKSAAFSEALQMIVQPNAVIEAGEDESQSWFAHPGCFEAVITPEHRVFRWAD